MVNRLGARQALAEELRTIRREARLTQDGLGKLAGLSRGTVKFIESEQQPKPATIRHLADGAATDGAGHRDPGKAADYYNRLMRAAGYLEDAPPPSDAAPADLSDEDIEAAIARYLEDDETALAFMGTLRRWRDLPRAAKLHILDTFRDADRMAERSERMQREIRSRQRG